MGRPKTTKPEKLTKAARFAKISEDKPLTPMEHAFVLEFIKCRNQTRAAVNAGFSEKTAKYKGHELVNLKPNTRKAIKDAMARFFDRLEYSAFDVLRNVCLVAMADATKLMQIKNGKVKIPNTEAFTDEMRALYAGAEERFDEFGNSYISIKTHNQLAAKKIMFDYYGLLNKERQAKHEPIAEQKRALRAVKNGEWTVLEAACYLEEEGVPLPRTIEILLNKQKESDEDPDDSDMVIPTPEEMERKRKERLREIEGQKKTFLPKRQQEVRDLKEELGDKNKAWDVGGGDGEKTE